MFYALVFLRLIAIFLIVNSHLDNLYPSEAFAFGGHLGNSLFFFISGYGLTLSFRKKPFPALVWGKRRLIKIVIPLVIYIGVANFGNMDGFLRSLWNDLIWHSLAQLEVFLPVLWLLYLLFLPLYKMNTTGLKITMAGILTISLILFIHRVNTVSRIPPDLPTSDIFFVFSALVCFTMGIYTAKTYGGITPEGRRVLYLITALLLVILPQGLHEYVKHLGSKYIFLNFYLNFFTIGGLFLFFASMPSPGSRYDGLIRFLDSLAACSLAVYIIHFKAVELIEQEGPAFPWNIAGVYLFSFVFAWSLTKFANFLSSYFLKTINRNVIES